MWNVAEIFCASVSYYRLIAVVNAPFNYHFKCMDLSIIWNECKKISPEMPHAASFS